MQIKYYIKVISHADTLTVNTNHNVTAPMRPVRPLRYIVYFMIVQ